VRKVIVETEMHAFLIQTTQTPSHGMHQMCKILRAHQKRLLAPKLTKSKTNRKRQSGAKQGTYRKNFENRYSPQGNSAVTWQG
jgi:hypothetical protein